MRVSLAVALLAVLPGCMDFSVDHYCAQYPDRCSMSAHTLYPDRGRAEGGTVVQALGMGFDPGTTVTVCGGPAQVTSISGTAVTFLAPPNLRGTTCDVVLHNESQTLTLPAAFFYPPNPVLESVEPSPVPNNGWSIVIHGQFLDPVSAVKIGGETMYSHHGTDTELTVYVPARAEGPATLEVTTAWGTTVDDKLLRFVAPWVASPPLPASPKILALGANPQRDGELWASVAGSGVWNHAPGASSWTLELQITGNDVGRIAMSGGAPYLATPNLIEGRDQSGRWAPTLQGHIRDLAAGPSGVWALSGDGLCRQSSQISWDCASTGLETVWSGGAVAVGAQGAYASAASGALYRVPGLAGTKLCESIGRVSAIAVEHGEPEYAYFAAGGDLFRTGGPSGTCLGVWSGDRIAALDAEPSGRGLLVMTDRAVYETLDSGATWSQLSLLWEWPVAMAHDGLGSKYVATANGQIQRLPAGGQVVELLSLGPVKQLEVDPNDGPHVLAISGWQLFQSHDAAASWTPVPLGDVPKPSSVFFGRTRGTIFAATPVGVRASRDSGATWQLLGDPRPIIDLAERGDGVLLAGLERGVLWSSNGGTTWTPDSAWSPASPVDCVAFLGSPSRGLVTTADSILSATGPGGSWGMFLWPSSTATRCRRLRTGPGAGVVVNIGLEVNSVALSPDGNLHWYGFLFTVPHDARASAHDIYLAGSDGLQRMSLSMTATWESMNSGLPDYDLSAVGIDPSDPKVLYIGSRTGQVFRSAYLGR